jgi:hypothetical protein
MSWRVGSSIFVDIYPIVKERITDDKHRKEFLASLVQLFLSNDMDAYDISEVDDELDAILSEINENDKPHESATNNAQLVTVKSVDGDYVQLDLNKDKPIKFKEVLGDLSHLKPVAFGSQVRDCFSKITAEHSIGVIHYLVDIGLELFREETVSLLATYSDWNILSEYFEKGLLEFSEIRLNKSIISLFINDYSLESYKRIVGIYRFAENKEVERDGLRTLLGLLFSSTHNQGALQLNRYDKAYDTKMYAKPLRELINWHIEYFKSDISDENAYGFLKSPKNVDNLDFLIQHGLNVNGTILFTELKFMHEGASWLMAAAGHGNLKAVKLLIKHGADVNTKDSGYDYTALDYATKMKKKKMIDYLEGLKSGSA